MGLFEFENISFKFFCKMLQIRLSQVAFFVVFLGYLLHQFHTKSRKCALFSGFLIYIFLNKLIKIPLLNEIHPFDNSVKVYESISGHTDRNPV